MTISEQVITIVMAVLGTMLTRFLPFLIFPAGKTPPAYVEYLGKALPSTLFGMLVVYCLRDVELLDGNHGLPEFAAVAVVALLHLWKRQMLLSIAGGTIFYMVLLQFVFTS